MAKQIIINYDGTDYTLEFNRNVVRRMEQNGFRIDTETPYTMITELFKGAFMMHHKRMTPDKIAEIWDAQKKKDDLLSALVQMYTEPITALMDEGDSGDDETPTWKIL